jgi:hypothetical protein
MPRAVARPRVLGSSLAEDLSTITEQCRRDFIECLPALIRIVSDPDQKAADVLRALQMLAHFAGLEKRFGELVDDAVTARVDTTSLSCEELHTLSRLLDRVDLLAS